jgi:hypothetical protein
MTTLFRTANALLDCHSIRIPEIARAITSCWISPVA